MRRREPMSIDRTWQHSVPVPMPNRPVCVTEHEAIDQLQSDLNRLHDLIHRCYFTTTDLGSIPTDPSCALS